MAGVAAAGVVDPGATDGVMSRIADSALHLKRSFLDGIIAEVEQSV